MNYLIKQKTEIEQHKNKNEINVNTFKAKGKKCSICWKIKENECERHPICNFK